MGKFCSNCGNPIEANQLFCMNCGAKLFSEEGDGAEKNPMENNNQINLTPPQAPVENQSTYVQVQDGASQPNVNPSYPAVKKKTNVGKIILIIGLVIFILSVLLVGIATISDIMDRLKSKSSNVTPTNNTPPATNVSDNKNDNANAAWTADLNANTNYDATSNTIYVDYSVKLKNNGPNTADNIIVYLNPEEGDENADYLAVEPKTIVDISGDVIVITSGETKLLETTFTYTDLKVEKITQEFMQDIANRFLQIPVLVEWEENGKFYSETLYLK